MAPRGNLNFFECTFNLKISYETVVFVSFDYILMFLVCSQTQLHFFVSFVICFGTIRCLKIAGVLRFTLRFTLRFMFYVLRFTFVCFVSRTFSVVNGSFPMVWILPWKNAAGPAWRSGQLREGRWRRYGSALFFSHTFVLGTNAHLFWNINFLLSTVLFRSCSQLRKSQSKVKSSSFFW